MRRCHRLPTQHAVDANRILAWPTIGRKGEMRTDERTEASSAEAGGSRKIIHIDMDASYGLPALRLLAYKTENIGL